MREWNPQPALAGDIDSHSQSQDIHSEADEFGARSNLFFRSFLGLTPRTLSWRLLRRLVANEEIGTGISV